ncbi:MAG: Molybdenum transport ATP-binding protein ModC, partial [uncultured Thermomicrobiales bacterium]
GQRRVRPRLQALRPGRGRERPLAADRGRRVHDPRRPLGLRQEHHPQYARRSGRGQRRRDPDRRRGRDRDARQRARHRDGVPELRPLSPHERPRQPGLRPQGPRRGEGGDRGEGRPGGGDARDRRPPGPEAAPVVGRPAATGSAGTGAGAGTPAVPARRAALQPRRQAAGPDAGRTAAAVRPAGDDGGLRHPRPGRGDDALRPGCDLRPGGGAAGRDADGAVRRPGQHLRRRLPRLAADDLPGGDGRRWGGRPDARRRGVRPRRAGAERPAPARPASGRRHPAGGHRGVPRCRRAPGGDGDLARGADGVDDDRLRPARRQADRHRDRQGDRPRARRPDRHRRPPRPAPPVRPRDGAFAVGM